jgi:hypothetical protein
VPEPGLACTARHTVRRGLHGLGEPEPYEVSDAIAARYPPGACPGVPRGTSFRLEERPLREDEMEALTSPSPSYTPR